MNVNSLQEWNDFSWKALSEVSQTFSFKLIFLKVMTFHDYSFLFCIQTDLMILKTQTFHKEIKKLVWNVSAVIDQENF